VYSKLLSTATSKRRSVRDADAFHQIVEPRIAVEIVELLRNFQKDEIGCTLVESPFEPFKGCIFLTQARMSGRDAK